MRHFSPFSFAGVVAFLALSGCGDSARPSQHGPQGRSFFLDSVANAETRQDHGCTQETLEGTYGYALSGPLIGVGRVAAMGLAIFDGESALSAQDTLNTAGVVTHRTGVGSYTVNANCTGSAKVGGEFGGFSFEFTIVPGSRGSEFSFLVTNSGTAQIGVAEKTGHECTLATLHGTYLNVGNQFDLGDGRRSKAVGFRIVDGAGNYSGEDSQSTDGIIAHRAITAVYTVNRDCTGTSTFTSSTGGGTGAQFDSVIVGGGAQAFFLSTRPGTIALGMFKKQSGRHEGAQDG